MSINEHSESTFTPYIIALWKKRVLIVVLSIVIGLLSFVNAFFIAEKLYKSHVTFFPPMAGGSSEILNTLGINLKQGASISPYQINDLFSSLRLKHSIIDKFNLIEKYKTAGSGNEYGNAVKRLDKEIGITQNEIGSFGMSQLMSYTIFALHTSPDTAKMMIDFISEYIDSEIIHFHTRSATDELEYLANQLAYNKNKLDSTQNAFHKFQIENKAFDLNNQISLAIQNYADLKSEVLQNQIKIETLKLKYSNNSEKINNIKLVNKVLTRKLRKYELKNSPDFYPGLNISQKMLDDYTEQFTNIETIKSLVAFLEKQIIQTELRKSRDISGIHIIDPPIVPEYKFKPKRIFLIVQVGLPCMMFVILLIILIDYYERVIKRSELYRRLINEVSNR